MSVASARVAFPSPLRGALPLLFIGPLFLLSFSARVASTPVLHGIFWAASGLLAAWYLFVVLRARSTGRALDYEPNIVKSHYVQAMVQGSVYVYWSQHWELINGQFLLILAQILFAYSFDMLLSWTRGKAYRFGFGPLPIILSSNFFLCFRDDWFYLQFAMIATGILGKEFIRWRREGRITHIFNPSAFGLFIFSIALIVSGKTGISWGEEFAVNLGQPDHMFLWLFFVGLVVQYFFQVTLVTLCAAAALYALNLIYTQLTGVYWFVDSGIPIAVFLGLHLLVTDPATSPRTNLGKAMFGLGYGAGVFGLYALLEWAGAPRFYDKLLCVPALNLSVQVLDRFARQPRLANLPVFARFGRLATERQNVVFMAVWITLFALMYATDFLGKQHPGRNVAFWAQACAEQRHDACRTLFSIYQHDCADGDPAACTRAGNGIAEGRLSSADALAQLRAFARGCDLGERSACSALSRSLNEDRLRALDAACDGHDANACYVLGSINLLSLAGKRDHAAAVRYFGRACDLRYATGCAVLGDAAKFGVGREKSAAAAVAAYERACSASSPVGCVSLAAMLASGDGVPSNQRRAEALSLKACRLGLKAACPP